MTATRDLIAAALTAADKLDIIGGHFSITADGVRELCARAMVQPDMGEVEKLLCIHENVVRMHANGLEWDKAPSATRAALLDYVRDHFRDAAKMVQPDIAEVPMPEPDIMHTGTDGELYGYWNEYQMIHYGDACKEAGYAAGGKDAERYRFAKLHGWPEYRREIHPNPNGLPQWGYCGHWFDSPDAAIDAALRGEVKP